MVCRIVAGTDIPSTLHATIAPKTGGRSHGAASEDKAWSQAGPSGLWGSLVPLAWLHHAEDPV